MVRKKKVLLHVDSKIEFINVKFGAFQLMWRLVALALVEERGGEQ